MRNVLADLAIESEAATVSARCGWRAPSTRRTPATSARSSSRRLATPVLKYWTCKRAPVHAVEALECLGGNGYVEESGMPRLYRESPLASIWEGSGNVQCLDVLRAMARNPASVEAFVAEVEEAAAPSRASTPPSRRFATSSSDLEAIESRARARGGADGAGAPGLAAGPLRRPGGRRRVLRLAPGAATRACAFGTLPAGTDFGRIIERHSPHA